MKESYNNILIITLDSCRWDSFQMAGCPNIKDLLDMRVAYTHATYTMPSHLSIYSGILPSTLELLPYYNRFSKQLFRLNNRKNVDADAYMHFETGTINIIQGFKERGYLTYCLGAVGWFRNPMLTEDFDEFVFTGIDYLQQQNLILQFIKKEKKPFFILLNIGETHDPYEFGGKIRESNLSRARMRKGFESGYIEEDHLKQVEAMRYIDYQLSFLLDHIKRLKRDTIVVICADHGECFGEDNLYGHGFYHEKIMEVPLGIGSAHGLAI